MPEMQQSISQAGMDAKMTMNRIAHHPIFQIILVIISASVFTFIADRLNFRSLWNAAWIFAIPALVGITLNEGTPRQLTMTFVLMVVSSLSLMATAAYFGLGY